MDADDHLIPTAESLFTIDGAMFVATELSRGPWDPRSCHGGPVSALMVRATESVGDGDNAWQLARITVELTRPVPVETPLTIETSIERPGRKVSLVAVTLRTVDGVEVARSRALRIRLGDVPLPDFEPEPVFSPPGEGRSERGTWAGEHVAFHRDSVEMRFVEGSWAESGPVALWQRLRVPVVPGEVPSGVQRAAAAADFGNGVSRELDADRHLFINPDLTVHLLRPPVGEWIGMRTRSHYGFAGAGLAESALYDESGRVGRSVQSLFVDPAG